MSVYVDGLVKWGGNDAPKCFRNAASCHMYADSVEELHDMALAMGLRRHWFQPHSVLAHYDLTAPRRADAIKRGAIEHDRRGMIEFLRRRGIGLLPSAGVTEAPAPTTHPAAARDSATVAAEERNPGRVSPEADQPEKPL